MFQKPDEKKCAADVPEMISCCIRQVRITSSETERKILGWHDASKAETTFAARHAQHRSVVAGVLHAEEVYYETLVLCILPKPAHKRSVFLPRLRLEQGLQACHCFCTRCSESLPQQASSLATLRLMIEILHGFRYPNPCKLWREKTTRSCKVLTLGCC